MFYQAWTMPETKCMYGIKFQSNIDLNLKDDGRLAAL